MTKSVFCQCAGESSQRTILWKTWQRKKMSQSIWLQLKSQTRRKIAVFYVQAVIYCCFATCPATEDVSPGHITCVSHALFTGKNKCHILTTTILLLDFGDSFPSPSPRQKNSHPGKVILKVVRPNLQASCLASLASLLGGGVGSELPLAH